MCIKSINNNSPGWTALMFMGPVRGCGLPQKAQFCFRALEKDQRLVEYKNNYQNWPMLLGNYVGRPRSICPRERVNYAHNLTRILTRSRARNLARTLKRALERNCIIGITHIRSQLWHKRHRFAESVT